MNAPLPDQIPTTVWQEAEHGKHVQLPTITPLSDLSSRTVLITGGSKGIGYEAALQLAQMGREKAPSKVIIAARSAAGNQSAIDRIKKETGYDRVEGREVDLMSLKDVKRFADELPTIDVLVNNAGFTTTDYKMTGDGIESCLQVNCVSPLLLTLLLLPKMREDARVVFVSSTFQESLPGLPSSTGDEAWKELNSEKASHDSLGMTHRYAFSKWLDVAIVHELARRRTSVLIGAACPGLCLTEFTGPDPNEWIKANARPAWMGARCVLWPSVQEGGALDATTRGSLFADCKLRSVKDELRGDEAKRLASELYEVVVKKLEEQVGQGLGEVAGVKA